MAAHVCPAVLRPWHRRPSFSLLATTLPAGWFNAITFAATNPLPSSPRPLPPPQPLLLWLLRLPRLPRTTAPARHIIERPRRQSWSSQQRGLFGMTRIVRNTADKHFYQNARDALDASSTASSLTVTNCACIFRRFATKSASCRNPPPTNGVVQRLERAQERYWLRRGQVPAPSGSQSTGFEPKVDVYI